jgi:uncharacterized membrane protein
MNVRRSVARRFFGRGRRSRARLGGVAGAMGIGAGAMYLLDPDRGPRRRALVRDRTAHALRRARSFAEKSRRDLGYRARGLLAELGAIFRHEVVTDDLLVQRVRARMGRAVSHPHAVEVSAADGRVTLRGPVLTGDVRELLSSVTRVPGVVAVDDQLEVHTQDDAVPALHGGYRCAGERSERWSPVARLALGLLGGGLVVSGLARGGRGGLAVAAAGAALLVRDVENQPLRRVLGVGAGRRAVDVHKTVTVRAPLSDVFAFFSAIENFPRFMAHVKEVRRTGAGRYHWVAAGPAGIPVSWDGEISHLDPDRALGWRSLPGARVGNAGIARFEPNADGSTRVDIQMSYNPPAGALGHLVASLFGADPKHALDEDMVRFQSILERGKTTAHGARVTAAEVAPKV